MLACINSSSKKSNLTKERIKRRWSSPSSNMYVCVWFAVFRPFRLPLGKAYARDTTGRCLQCSWHLCQAVDPRLKFGSIRIHSLRHHVLSAHWWRIRGKREHAKEPTRRRTTASEPPAISATGADNYKYIIKKLKYTPYENIQLCEIFVVE